MTSSTDLVLAGGRSWIGDTVPAVRRSLPMGHLGACGDGKAKIAGHQTQVI